MPAHIFTIIPENMVQRFSGNPFIEFKNFSRTEATEFVKSLFKTFRKKEYGDEYYPYSQKGFDRNLSFRRNDTSSLTQGR